VRFELSAYALAPSIRVIAPWREWNLNSRERLLAYAEENGIDIRKAAGGGSPYSTDANALHISYEGGVLEDPWTPAEEAMWETTVAPEYAPDTPQFVDLDFARGDIIAIDGQRLSPYQALAKLNELAGAHGIGRIDIVENRYVGMKSRGCYETPGGTVMLRAHRAIESITLDREAAHLKDELMSRYAQLIYNGYWFAPERHMLQAAIDASQAHVNGTVRVKLYKGSVGIVGRQSAADSLYDVAIYTFEDDRGAYDQADAAGFIRLNALRLRLGHRQG
jgi:argininosuccinate synthase